MIFGIVLLIIVGLSEIFIGAFSLLSPLLIANALLYKSESYLKYLPYIIVLTLVLDYWRGLPFGSVFFGLALSWFAYAGLNMAIHSDSIMSRGVKITLSFLINHLWIYLMLNIDKLALSSVVHFMGKALLIALLETLMYMFIRFLKNQLSGGDMAVKVRY